MICGKDWKKEVKIILGIKNDVDVQLKGITEKIYLFVKHPKINTVKMCTDHFDLIGEYDEEKNAQVLYMHHLDRKMREDLEDYLSSYIPRMERGKTLNFNKLGPVSFHFKADESGNEAIEIEQHIFTILVKK